MSIKIKNSFLVLSIITFLFSITVTLFIGCNEKPADSLYDPNYVSRPQPVIQSVSPSDYAFAGYSVITLTGSNFSNVLAENKVYFNSDTGSVIEATTSTIKVKVPNLASDSIRIRVSVFKAELFSENFNYKLKPAVQSFGGLKDFEEPFSLSCDKQGNIYISILSSGVGAGVSKITPEGVKTDNWSARNTSISKYTNMKFGPGNLVYVSTNQARLLTIPAAGGASANWITSGLGTIADFDFDVNGNMWAGGNAANIYRIKQDKTIKTYPFVANIKGVRVYNNKVYVAGKKDAIEGVWSAPLTADELGTFSLVLNLADLPELVTAKSTVLGVTFASDGVMYVLTDYKDPVLIVNPDNSKSYLYPGLISPVVNSMHWSKDNYLYLARTKSASTMSLLLKIDMQKNSAPYFGRGDQ